MIVHRVSSFTRPAFAAVLIALMSAAYLGAGEAPVSRGTSGLVLESVATGLVTVLDITHAGDDRLFLSQQGGQILIHDAGSTSTFLDISGLVGAGLEGGIKSVAFHPEYAANGYFFVHYSDAVGDSVIARYEVSAGDPDVADPGSAAVLITVDQTTDLHRGGQMQFGPDGYLYISLGDDDSQGSWSSELLPISLPGITTFGEDSAGNLFAANGSELFRVDDPGAIFYDAFESGDTSAWSSVTP